MKIEEKIENRIKMLELDIQIAENEIASNNSMIDTRNEEIKWCEEQGAYAYEVKMHKCSIKDLERQNLVVYERYAVLKSQLYSLNKLLTDENK